ncbi:MAG: hypothetical protein R3B09_04865 [Nannocystaceae bacterium]
MIRSATRPRSIYARALEPALSLALASALAPALASCTPRSRPAEEATPTPTPTPEAEPPVKAAEPAPEPTPSITRHDPRPRTIAVGGSHVCALVGAGEVACWGAGRDGQLGPGIADHRATPTTIAGISDAIAVLASRTATCALRPDRSLTCWGKLETEGGAIQTIKALGDVVEVAMSDSYESRLCGRRSDGTVACVALAGLARGTPQVLPEVSDAVGLELDGRDLFVLRASGELLKVTFELGKPSPATPVEGGVVVDLDRVNGRICMLLQSGEMRCRGYPDAWRAEVPVAGPLWKAKIPGELWASAVDFDAEGGVLCVRDGEGAVVCSGDNTYGQLGGGTPAYSIRPRRIFDGAATAVSAGAEATCGVYEEGKLRCFEHSIVEIDAPEVEGVRALAISTGHDCAIVGGGEARCWGFSETGALGATGSPEGLVRVPGLSNLTFIGTGEDHTCAVRRDSGVRCWGSGALGQLASALYLSREEEGEGETEEMIDQTYVAGPVTIKGITGDVTGLAVAGDYACVATTTGLHCWGTIPELGNLDDALIVRPRQFLAGPIAAIDAEESSLCVVDGDGGLRCWGPVAEHYRDGADVHLAEEEEDDDDESPPEAFSRGGPLWKLEAVPVAPVGLAVGSEHACLLTAAGEVHCWGDNNQGQLGDGTTRDRPTPVKVEGLPGPATQIVAGSQHTCALVDGGAIYCWGAKTSAKEHGRRTATAPVVGLARYKRGDGPTPPRSTPPPPAASPSSASP